MSGKLSFHDWKSRGILPQKTCRNPVSVCLSVCECVSLWYVGRVVCPYHADELCGCNASRHCLRYRHTLNELLTLLSQLKDNITAFTAWSRRVNTACTVSDTGQKTGTLISFMNSLTYIILFE